MDTPDGMQVEASGPEETNGPGVQFYTGRFPVIFDVGEVEELIAVLQTWVDAQKPPPTNPTPQAFTRAFSQRKR